jgi:ribosome-associated heat shock protein Hsp15
MASPVIPVHSLRIDKWLWAARFFKTRTLASDACDGGKILCNRQPAKPSRVVKAGDTLEISNEGGVYTVEVLELAEERGSATVAQTLYRETDASRELRAKVAEARRIMLAEEPNFARMRPNKRDRRLIHSFRGKD